MGDWLFDLGNTRLKFAPLRDGDAGAMTAIAHDGNDFDTGWTERLPRGIVRAAVASVAAPALRDALRDVLASRGVQVRFAAPRAHCIGVRIAYAQPGDLGVDRFLALLAAHARGGAWLVAGVGTALTVDLLDGEGRHHGGRIAPSPSLMRAALYARVRQLPAAGGDYRAFAGGTHDGLASGCIGAAAGLLERSLREAQTALGHAPGLLLHGGGADDLVPHFPQAVVEPRLVLQGLARWACAEAG